MTLQDIDYVTYEADVHCWECAVVRFGELQIRLAKALDNEGNEVRAVHSWEEGSLDEAGNPEAMHCGTCGKQVREGAGFKSQEISGITYGSGLEPYQIRQVAERLAAICATVEMGASPSFSREPVTRNMLSGAEGNIRSLMLELLIAIGDFDPDL